MNYLITAACKNNHTQTLKVGKDLGRPYAEELADLLDGTSTMYVHSPIYTDSVIGKCGICRARLTCTVSDEA
jgi:hypothetical protein